MTLWTPEVIATVASGAAAVLGLVGAGAKYALDLSHQRKLQRGIGVDVYDPEAIHRAVRYYIEPNCTSVDPAQEAEPKSLIVAEEPVMRVLDRFLAEGAETRHLVILADSGMGKSSLLLNYYARNQRRHGSTKHQIALVHLGLPNADERIRSVAEKSRTALFLDAFDEDTKAIKDHRSRIAELLELGAGFRRILLTSRTQFFPSDEEIPQNTGLLKTGSRGLESGIYEFRKLYLAPFSDQMVKRYLRKRYPILRSSARRRAEKLVGQVPLLSVRPMLLTYLPDLITSKQSPTSAYGIYDMLVDKWYERESPWVEKQALKEFSTQLAVDLFVNRLQRGAERIGKTELEPLAREWGIPLDDWQLRGRSLLNRDAENKYKFAHRSIMEFLIAKVIVDSPLGTATEPFETLRDYLRDHAILTLDSQRPFRIDSFDYKWPGLTDQIENFLRDVSYDWKYNIGGKKRSFFSSILPELVDHAKKFAIDTTSAVFAPTEVERASRVIITPIYGGGTYPSAFSSGPKESPDPRNHSFTFQISNYSTNLQWMVGFSFNENFDWGPVQARFESSTEVRRWREPTPADLLTVSIKARNEVMSCYVDGNLQTLSELMERVGHVSEGEAITLLLRESMELPFSSFSTGLIRCRNLAEE